MNLEIFRFAVVRATQPVPEQNLTRDAVILSKESPLIDQLRKAKSKGSRKDMLKLAGEFIKSGKLIDSVSKTDSRLLSFADALIDRKKIDYNAFIRDTFQTIFNTTPAAFARSAEYKNALQSVSDSVVTSAIDNSVSAKSKFILLQLAPRP